MQPRVLSAKDLGVHPLPQPALWREGPDVKRERDVTGAWLSIRRKESLWDGWRETRQIFWEIIFWEVPLG